MIAVGENDFYVLPWCRISATKYFQDLESARQTNLQESHDVYQWVIGGAAVSNFLYIMWLS